MRASELGAHVFSSVALLLWLQLIGAVQHATHAAPACQPSVAACAPCKPASSFHFILLLPAGTCSGLRTTWACTASGLAWALAAMLWLLSRWAGRPLHLLAWHDAIALLHGA